MKKRLQENPQSHDVYILNNKEEKKEIYKERKEERGRAGNRQFARLKPR